MPVAVLSPHLDDAVLSCWQVLDGGDDVVVVNVFSAAPPIGTPAPWWDRLTGAADPVQRMQERRDEDRRALAVAGRRAVHLDLLDDQYRSSVLDVGAVVARLAVALEPGALLYAPAGLGQHPDHLLVRDAALRLARRGWPVTLYADLPHAIVDGWPSWVTGEPQARGLEVASAWTAVLQDAGLDAEHLTPGVAALEEGARRRKLQALEAYASQRLALDRLSFVPLDDPRALAWEVSWGVDASAADGTQEQLGEPRVADAGGDRRDVGG